MEYLNNHIITVEEMFENKKQIKLNERKLQLFLNGVKLTHKVEDDLYRIYNSSNEFIGIGIVKNELLKRDIIL